jgi:hypothetical protein
MNPNAQRPFNFMIPFWGPRFTSYFIDLCLPSLLASGNIALLRPENGHRFLMATTREDWKAIEPLPIMDRLRRHAIPTLVEVEHGEASPTSTESGAIGQYSSVIKHQTTCLKRLFDEAYRNRSYGCLLSPDCIISNGLVAAMIRYVQNGFQFVMCPALRQKEESVLADLERMGYLRAGERASLTGRPLEIPPRVAADLFVRHLHPEMAAFEYTSPKPTRPFISPFCYWRVPGGRGMILHEFFGVPVVIDFESVRPDHSECLNRDDYENVYLMENFFRGYNGRVEFVRDSDEFNIISITPEAANFSASTAHTQGDPLWKRTFAQLCDIRDSMAFYVGLKWAPVRRDLFLKPFRLHVSDIDEIWLKEERRAARIISLVVGDYRHANRSPVLDCIDPIVRSGARMVLFETSKRMAVIGAVRGAAVRALAARSRLTALMRQRTAGLVRGLRASVLNRAVIVGIARRLLGPAIRLVRRPFRGPPPPQ